MSELNKKRLEGNIKKLYIFHALLGMMITMPIVTLFFQENGLSMQDVFVVQAVFSISVLLFEVPSGYISDKLGHKRALVLGSLVITLGAVIYALAYGFWAILFAEVVLGIGYAFISGADSALLYNTLISLNKTDEHKRIESRVVATRAYSQAAGGIAGGIIGAINLRYPFIIWAIVLVFTIPVALSLVEPAVKRVKDASTSVWQEMIKIIKYSLHGHKELKWIIIYAGAINTSTLVFVWFMQPYWQLLNIPIAWFGVLWAILNVSIGVFAMFATKFESLLGLRKALIALVALVVATYILLGLFPYLFILPVILIFYFVRAVQQPILRDYVHRRIESDVRATVLSIKNLVGRLMFIIVGPALGYASDLLSLPMALLLSAGTFAIVGLTALIFLHKNKAL